MLFPCKSSFFQGIKKSLQGNARLVTVIKKLRMLGVFIWWERMDSDHRSMKATDLQSAPFGHSGTLPFRFSRKNLSGLTDRKWSWWTDSNPRPADYKSAALPTELHQRLTLNYYITDFCVCQVLFSNFSKIFLK